MTESNKGRFKVADEAQAVWIAAAYFYRATLDVDLTFGLYTQKKIRNIMDDTANALYQARLIHGSIYDEHGRIEDKDVAQAVDNAFSLGDTSPYCRSSLPAFETQAQNMLKRGEIRGTIFY